VVNVDILKDDAIHVMVDIETLGLDPDSVILQIAAVKFDRNGPLGLFSGFDMLVDPDQDGRVINVDTLKWWSQQPSFTVVLSSMIPLHEVLDKFYDYIRIPQPDYFWSKGNFDFPILENAFKGTGIKGIPWHYRRVMDARTVYELTGIKPVLPAWYVAHNAYDDATYQAEALGKALTVLRKTLTKSPNSGQEEK
jgi:exodeoxyribonuclease VIII